MLIDWFTVVAQLINFLILVWLLKRFLYKPILKAIDEREHGIAAQLAQAEAKKNEAQKQRDDFQHKNQAFDSERAALLQKATEDAKAQRQKLLVEARTEADALRAKRQEALRNEQRDLGQEINRWTQKEVFSIARKMLRDLAAVSLEERMTAVFEERLRALAGAPKELMAGAFKTSTVPAKLRSAFDLPPQQHSAIQKALNETFSADIHVQFETEPDLVGGIELSVSGQKVAWSIADYLRTLEISAEDLLKRDTESTLASRQPTRPEQSNGAIGKHNGSPKPPVAAEHGPSKNADGAETAASAPKADH